MKSNTPTSAEWKPLVYLFHNIVIIFIIWITILGAIMFMWLKILNSPNISMSPEHIVLIKLLLIIVSLIWTSYIFIMEVRQYHLLIYSKELKFAEFDIPMNVLETEILEKISKDDIQASVVEYNDRDIEKLNVASSYKVNYDDRIIHLFFANQTIQPNENQCTTIFIGPWEPSNSVIINLIISVINEVFYNEMNKFGDNSCIAQENLEHSDNSGTHRLP